MSPVLASLDVTRITARKVDADASPRTQSLPGLVEAGMVLEWKECGAWCVSWPNGRLSAFPNREGLERWWEWQREVFLERRTGFASLVGAAATASEKAHARLLHRVRLIRTCAPFQWRDHFADVSEINPDASAHGGISVLCRWLESTTFWADVEDAVVAAGIQRERSDIDALVQASLVRARLPRRL